MSPNTTPNTANIRAWVDALRSGDFEQGIGALRTERADGSVAHCCLGVACEVAIAHGVGIKRNGGTYNNRTANLPAAAAEWLGLSANPAVAGCSAASRNDILCQSFAEIATVIEAEYLA